jgi:hypothetical protein
MRPISTLRFEKAWDKNRVFFLSDINPGVIPRNVIREQTLSLFLFAYCAIDRHISKGCGRFEAERPPPGPYM